MTDPELVRFATEFRAGLLAGQSSRLMCAAVSWPLASLLRVSGVDCETEDSIVDFEWGVCEHVWIRLADGRVLDPTADQFNSHGYDFPPVYLGPATEELHQGDHQ